MSEYYLPANQILKPLQVGKYGALDRYRDYYYSYWLSTALCHVYEEIVDIPLLYAFPLEWKNGAPNYDDFVMQSTIKERVWVWYVDSVAGGKDMSGDGSKENPFRSINSVLNILAYLNYYNLCNNKCFMIKVKGVVDYDIENKECQCVAGSGAVCFVEGNYTKHVSRNNGSPYLRASAHSVWYTRILLRGWTDEQRVKITGSVALSGCTFIGCDFEIPEKGSISAGHDVFVDCSFLSKEKEEICFDAGVGGYYRLFVEYDSSSYVDNAFNAKLFRCRIYFNESVARLRGALFVECDVLCNPYGHYNDYYPALFYKGRIHLVDNKEKDEEQSVYLKNIIFVGVETIFEGSFILECCSFLNMNISKISGRIYGANFLNTIIDVLDAEDGFTLYVGSALGTDIWGLFYDSKIKLLKSKSQVHLSGNNNVWLYEMNGTWNWDISLSIKDLPFIFEYKNEKKNLLGLLDFYLENVEVVGELYRTTWTTITTITYGLSILFSFSCFVNNVLFKKVSGVAYISNAINTNIENVKIEEVEDVYNATHTLFRFFGYVENVNIKLNGVIKVYNVRIAISIMGGQSHVIKNISIRGIVIDSSNVSVEAAGYYTKPERDCVFENINLDCKIKSTFWNEYSNLDKGRVSKISYSLLPGIYSGFPAVNIYSEEELSRWLNLARNIKIDVTAEKHVNSEECAGSSSSAGYYSFLNGFEYTYEGKRYLYGDGNVALCRQIRSHYYEWLDMSYGEYFERFYGT